VRIRRGPATVTGNPFSLSKLTGKMVAISQEPGNLHPADLETFAEGGMSRNDDFA
jgi:hypothetical protein